jgi:hypothetical protein
VTYQERMSGAIRCFCCFSRKFTAGDLFFAAEILGSGRCGSCENSEMPAVFRCFPLFPSVFTNRGGIAVGIKETFIVDMMP